MQHDVQEPFFVQALLPVDPAKTVPVHTIQWTLDYPDLDYPNPRLSGSRTEIIARAYNDLRMRVVAVDKKLLYTWLLNQLFCQLKIVRLLDKAVYSTSSSPCSQQLSLFTATGKRIWPIRTFHLSSMVFLLLWPKGSG